MDQTAWVNQRAASALARTVAVSGYLLSGGIGVQDFSRAAASLVQLVILLVPLTALLLGVLTLASDRGNTELLFSQPVSRAAILLGRVLGLDQALISAQAIGFGAAGLVIYTRAGEDGIVGFLVVVAAAFVLTGVCLGLAAFIASGNIGRRRSRALAVALVARLVLVVLAGLAALGGASLLRSGAASRRLSRADI
jgi:Cu-processing system permease protein